MTPMSYTGSAQSMVHQFWAGKGAKADPAVFADGFKDVGKKLWNCVRFCVSIETGVDLVSLVS